MPRLRIRMELNRGGVGVPLHKLASVVDEAQKFFHLLGQDVRIEKDRGEWLGSDFDNKSLNFTAEYVGPVDAAQVREFYAAFDGVTLLRRATIAQFARIADAIDEDELIGFGLYQNDEETEPGEWRSLSKREALRITEEIRLLLDRAGGSEGETRIPASLDQANALFRDRREHGGLAERMARLENEVGRHSEAIQTLRGTTANTEQNLQNLLVAVNAFCDKATRQMERLPAPEQAARQSIGWRIPVTAAVLCGLAALALFRGANEPKTSSAGVEAAVPASKTVPAAAQPAARQEQPVPKAPPAPAATRSSMAPVAAKALVSKVDLKAIEPTWVAVYVDDKLEFTKLIDTDRTKTIESAGKIRVRLGNAGGIEVTANGKPVGPVGRKGEVRTLEITASGFRIIHDAPKAK